MKELEEMTMYGQVSDKNAVIRPFTPAPEIQGVLRDIAVLGNPLENLTEETLPALRLRREEEARLQLRPITVARVENLTITAENPRREIPLRIFYPLITDRRPSGAQPILIYLHGGGWVLGSLNTHDAITRALANKIPAIVVAVDYRLAPEHPFPAAFDDVFAATSWVIREAVALGGDPDAIGLGGDSAGGNLAIVTARRARRADLKIAFQFLFYPSTDLGDMSYPSYAQYGRDHYLTRGSVEAFRAFYVPSTSEWSTPEVSPLRGSPDDFSSEPPSLIVVAGCDPLRDEGIAYAEKMRANGAKVLLINKEDMIHGFLGLFNFRADATARVEAELDEISARIWEFLPGASLP